MIDVLGSAAANHRVDVTGGVLADECRALLQAFFRARRGAVERRRLAAVESAAASRCAVAAEAAPTGVGAGVVAVTGGSRAARLR